MQDRIAKMLDKLPHDRELTRKRIDQQQIKQKSYHDKQIKFETKFKIGDKVLLYRAEKEKQWIGKLENKWKGPYYIHLVLPNGSYKIRQMDGKVLATPFNGRLLKSYKDRRDLYQSIKQND